ncbi:MAG: copper-translocating P-type ATPase [Gammaproteobacteria bacterium]|nr:MAG: copper-translocating P-type ATPase [Gammaproteobacteria bacterium]
MLNSNTGCFHCGLPIPAGSPISMHYQGEERVFCCEGCKAVTYSIIHNGLEDYYQHREANSQKAEELDEQVARQLEIYDRPDIQAELIAPLSDDIETKAGKTESTYDSSASFYIDGITCAACIWLIEKYIGNLPGVESVSVNHTTQVAVIKWHSQKIKLSEILKSIHRIGYHARPFKPDDLTLLHKKQQRQAILRLGIAGIGMMQNMMLAIPLYLGGQQFYDQFLDFFRWISLLVATPVVCYSARPFFDAALRDLSARHLTMDVPVSLAILAAYLASCWITINGGEHVYFDSVCMFTFFLSLGRFLEMRTRFKASAGMHKLATLLPQTATKVDSHGDLLVIPSKELAPGDKVLVRAGETLPCDGVIIDGTSTIDESAITGEYLPQTKSKGDIVIGGTTNVESALTVAANKTGQNARLSSIIKLFEHAITDKPRMTEIADSVASYFVGSVLLIASCVFVYWEFFSANPSLGRAFEITLSVLVVTCPCALSLATPTTFTAAIDGLRSAGLLVIKGHAIETLGRINHVVFDKTGTLTIGKLTISKQKYFMDNQPQSRLFAIACAMEQKSTHPIARAFIESPSIRLERLQQIAGEGVEASYQGVQYRIGSESFVTRWLDQTSNQALRSLESDNCHEGPIVYFANKEKLLAVYYLEDTIREEAKATINQLDQTQIDSEILSGDREEAVRAAATLLDIENYTSGATPETKQAHLEHLKNQGKIVAMIGDGINDIPVMAAAHLSIAMGQASDITKVHADSLLLKNDLSCIPVVIAMGKRANRIIKQNITWAITYNILALPLAVAGMIPPYLAAIGMSLSSLLVVINALRAKKFSNLKV